ncbi:J domain-containing protein (plasmid) [Euhalothece natronophila Z-M001]|uniref:J domain-containing protein n=1 Tax=Euhalothece natronophila Z-M001 TaxID=522448 RepID=A0A5B8NTB9_9CHRO|nr:J domain-containing protein [Euhalothece natronophila]QDZ41619.1 J domain-containing protein [Euhalothece natronophila Z-M001]
MTYTLEQLETITSLNPAHKQAIETLLSFYQFIRSTWTASAIAQLKQAHDLDLRRKQDRLQLAHLAAREELDFARSLPQGLEPLADLPPETQYQPETPETAESESDRYARLEKFTLLLLTGRILPSGQPLNGTQDAPAMRILGSPKTLTELEYNYKQLVKHHHPDISPFSTEEAQARFTYVRKLYQLTRRCWEQLNPTATISQETLQHRLKARVPYSPESFWYWLE